MTDETTRARRAYRLAELVPWVGVFIESLGGVLCCLGVVAIKRSTVDTYVLVAVGAPLIVIGVLILWWDAR